MAHDLGLALDIVSAELWRLGFVGVGGLAQRAELCARKHDAARGDAGYSPICRVLSYRPGDPGNLARSVAEIDSSTVLPDRRGYVYCFQVAP